MPRSQPTRLRTSVCTWYNQAYSSKVLRRSVNEIHWMTRFHTDLLILGPMQNRLQQEMSGRLWTLCRCPGNAGRAGLPLLSCLSSRPSWY
eukprot:6480219-Amphidinium_carterae.1